MDDKTLKFNDKTANDELIKKYGAGTNYLGDEIITFQPDENLEKLGFEKVGHVAIENHSGSTNCHGITIFSWKKCHKVIYQFRNTNKI